jgi:hypothetical protein
MVEKRYYGKNARGQHLFCYRSSEGKVLRRKDTGELYDEAVVLAGVKVEFEETEKTKEAEI